VQHPVAQWTRLQGIAESSQCVPVCVCVASNHVGEGRNDFDHAALVSAATFRMLSPGKTPALDRDFAGGLTTVTL
jgi:hypothetical protein